MEQYDIFISYSQYDKELVHSFAEYINKAMGKDCWIDRKGIKSGEEFEEIIMKAIDGCQVVLFMLSDNSLKSKWTKREVYYAEDEGKRIVPVLVNGEKLRGWFKFHFGNVDFININSKEQKEKLIENLRTWLRLECDVIKEEKGLPKNHEVSIQDSLNTTHSDVEVHIDVDADCDLFCFNTFIQHLIVGEDNVVHLPKGKYKFDFIATQVPAVKKTLVHSMTTNITCDFIEVKLREDVLQLIEKCKAEKGIKGKTLTTHSSFFSDIGLMSKNEDYISRDDKNKIYMVFNGTNDSSKIGIILGQALTESFSNDSLYGGVISDASLHLIFSAKLIQLFSNSGIVFTNNVMATMALLKLYDDGALIAWIGDCRVYRIRIEKNWRKKLLNRQQCEFECELLTKDHTLVQRYVDSGQITPDMAKYHPDSSKLTRAISPKVSSQSLLEIRRCDVQKGDFFVLCTKGVFEHIDIEKMLSMMVDSDCITEIELAKGMNYIAGQRAYSEGKGDNRSACVVRVL